MLFLIAGIGVLTVTKVFAYCSPGSFPAYGNSLPGTPITAQPCQLLIVQGNTDTTCWVYGKGAHAYCSSVVNVPNVGCEIVESDSGDTATKGSCQKISTGAAVCVLTEPALVKQITAQFCRP